MSFNIGYALNRHAQRQQAMAAKPDTKMIEKRAPF
jgi:hypothetical protein